MKSSYRFISDAWGKTAYKDRIRTWNKQNVVTRIDKPTRLDRARALGYKAKQGFVLARIRIKKGGRRRKGVGQGKKPSKSGLVHFTPGQSKQAIAEKRAARKFPNLEVLNSYPVGQNGVSHYFEVILIDPHHPVIRADPRTRWIVNQRRRVFRGLTSTGKKGRGL